MRRDKALVASIGVLAVLLLVSCSQGADVNNNSSEKSTAVLNENTDNSIEDTAENEPEDTDLQKTDSEIRILVSDGNNDIIFALNGSPAAKSLYDQLPLIVDVEDYSTNEKIFYPPEKLDGTDAIEGRGPFGSLAYFSPWGNVVMYYSECGPYPGLYLLGEAVEGAESIEKLQGKIQVEVYDEN